MRVLLSVLALVAIVYADCLSSEVSVFTGIVFNGANLAGLSASGTYQLASIPVCQAAFNKTSTGYTSCCAAGTFDVIRAFGGNYSQYLDTAFAALQKADANNFGIDTAGLTGPEADLLNKIVSSLKKFFSAFVGDYKACLGKYRQYLQGVLCSLCRPDFFPDIASYNNLTDSFTFNFAPSTCTELTTACGPTIQDIVNFENDLESIVTAFLQQEGISLSSLNITNSSFNFLQGVPGSTLEAQISYYFCQEQISGFSNADLVDFDALLTALSGELQNYGGTGKKRDSLLVRITNAFRHRKSALRQSSTTISNSYTGTYDPVATGEQMDFITGAASSVVVSAVFVVAAALGLFLF